MVGTGEPNIDPEREKRKREEKQGREIDRFIGLSKKVEDYLIPKYGNSVEVETVAAVLLDSPEGERVLGRVGQEAKFAKYVATTLDAALASAKDGKQEPPGTVGTMLETQPWIEKEHGKLEKSQKPLAALVTVARQLYEDAKALYQK